MVEYEEISRELPQGTFQAARLVSSSFYIGLSLSQSCKMYAIYYFSNLLQIVPLLRNIRS